MNSTIKSCQPTQAVLTIGTPFLEECGADGQGTTAGASSGRMLLEFTPEGHRYGTMTASAPATTGKR
jgi:hypothetical protein